MDSVFFIALQSSIFLGLIHGINPCGHSWVVLAPFVVGKKVVSLTTAFILGTTLACLLLGATLGALSTTLPPSIKIYVDFSTAGIIILLGLILLVKPHLLHSNDHC